jgi:hypothetical protein
MCEISRREQERHDVFRSPLQRKIDKIGLGSLAQIDFGYERAGFFRDRGKAGSRIDYSGGADDKAQVTCVKRGIAAL